MADSKPKKKTRIHVGTAPIVIAPEPEAVETVQDSIPIQTVHDKLNLIESYPGEYSRTYKLDEINYATLNEDEQEKMFERWQSFLNSLGSNTDFQLTIFNRSIDMESFCDSVLKKERGDDLDYLRRELNDITLERVTEGKNGIQSDKYITLAVHTDTADKANEVFHRLDKDTDNSLQKLGSGAKPVSIEDRLDILFDIYNPGHSGELLTKTKMVDENGVTRDVAAFDFDNLRSMGLRVNDVIAPSSITFKNDYIEIGDKFARVLKVKDYPAILGDDFLTDITAMDFNVIATLNVKPLANADADSLVSLNLTLVRAEKQKAMQRAVREGGDEYSIAPAILEREEEALALRDDMRQHDQRLFETTLTFVVFADNLVDLKEYTDTIISEGRKKSVSVQTMVGLQDDGFNSTLPLCYNRIRERRTLKTSSVAALMPFSVTELNDPDGINYSMNAVTRNLVLYDRTKQLNSNGFILGSSGSGKSFAAKTEMLSVILGTDSDVIVIDPEREYGPLSSAVHGEVIKVMPGGTDHINPMAIYVDRNDEGDPVLEKIDFITNFMKTIMGNTMIGPVEEAIIDRCVHNLFDQFYVEEGDRKVLRVISEDEMPTLTDFFNLLNQAPEQEARDMAYAVSTYTEGHSLDIFGGKTNVDLDNRFVVFDINALGKKMYKPAMLIILDLIWNRIVENRALGKHTWFYVDEIYLLFQDEVSAQFLQQLWKRARKYGGCATGITQNVEDLLSSNTARTMLANSSFVEMLNQATTDREQLVDLLHLSESQSGYITDAPRGQGLIYTGSQTVPIYSRFPKNNDIYKVLTSDMLEIKAFEEQDYLKKLQQQEQKEQSKA